MFVVWLLSLTGKVTVLSVVRLDLNNNECIATQYLLASKQLAFSQSVFQQVKNLQLLIRTQ